MTGINSSDSVKVKKRLRFASCRISAMNMHLVRAMSVADTCIEERGEINKDEKFTIEHHLRKYENERDKLDNKMVELEQLVNP